MWVWEDLICLKSWNSNSPILKRDEITSYSERFSSRWGGGFTSAPCLLLAGASWDQRHCEGCSRSWNTQCHHFCGWNQPRHPHRYFRSQKPQGFLFLEVMINVKSLSYFMKRILLWRAQTNATGAFKPFHRSAPVLKAVSLLMPKNAAEPKEFST